MNKIKVQVKTLAIVFLSLMMLEKLIKADGISIPVSKPLTEKSQQSFQGLLNNITSYPSVIIDDTTNQVVQVPVTRVSRFVLPFDVISMAQLSNLSMLRPLDSSVYKKYPSGAALFPKNSNVATQFDGVIASIQHNQELIKFFRKIHLNCLNQMYAYFMEIYTNLLVRHVGSSRDASGKVIVDTQSFLVDEQTYATNQKILIMSYLVNLIESQFHAMTLAYSKKTPYIFATVAGKMVIQNDFSIDLSVFCSPQTDQAMQSIQSSYIDFLKKYINFFQTYTNLLSQQDKATGFTQFYTAAQNIISGSYQTSMNPGMFFYDDESLRAIKMIPYLAGQLPAKTIAIGWAENVVDAAKKGLIKDGHRVAYFKDSENNITQDPSKADSLHLLSKSGDNIFEEELLKQPDWLNSAQGVISMVQACLGDFSKIVGLYILDPFTQAILEKTVLGSISVQTAQDVQDLSLIIAPENSTQAVTTSSTKTPPSDKK